MALYLLSLGALLALALAVYLLAGAGSDERGLGVVVACVVLLLDGVTALGYRGGLLQDTGSVMVVMAASRFLLLAAGTRLWLLGVAATYAVYGVFLSRLSVQRLMHASVISSLDGSGSSKSLSEAAVRADGTDDGLSDSILGQSAAAVPTTEVGAGTRSQKHPSSFPVRAGDPRSGGPPLAGREVSIVPKAGAVTAAHSKRAGMAGSTWTEFFSSPLFLLVVLTSLFSAAIAVLAVL